jgi:hypothetical protein
VPGVAGVEVGVGVLVVASSPTTVNSLAPVEDEAAGVFVDDESPEPRRPGKRSNPFFLFEQAKRRSGMVITSNIFFILGDPTYSEIYDSI